VALMIAEQNAESGLANRVASRWASRRFLSFPETRGLESGEWVGNPVRRELSSFDRDGLRREALARYDFQGDIPVVGVFGGSLGAGAINEAVAAMARSWDGDPLQIVHLTGSAHLEEVGQLPSAPNVTWRRVGFEERMDLFYAVSDLAVARAGGGVAELTATATPAILVPGEFGSAGHQSANAAFVASVGAAVVVTQNDLSTLGAVVSGLVHDPARLSVMRQAAGQIARPHAAETIATAMLEAAA